VSSSEPRRFAQDNFFSAPKTLNVDETAATDTTPAVTEERVREELKNVVDPEIGLDMVSLGLLYGVTVEGSKVHVLMTLTTPACPVGPMFVNAVHAAVMGIPGVTECHVDLTFSPPWDPRTMASDEVKLQMGFYY
jgi:metal-sulfur cluster biosynthetic enzyme